MNVYVFLLRWNADNDTDSVIQTQTQYKHMQIQNTHQCTYEQQESLSVSKDDRVNNTLLSLVYTLYKKKLMKQSNFVLILP